MSSNTTPCWACSYIDPEEDQAECQICSPVPSSSAKTHLPSPSTADSPSTIPTISATKLRKVWQRCGSEITKEWRDALDLIRTLSPRKRFTSWLKENAFSEAQGPSQTIKLQDGDYFKKTPSITLTSASPTSAPTMNLVTWHTFEQRAWSKTVHVTTIQSKKKKHRRTKACESCKSDVEVNRKWAEAMGINMEVETVGRLR